MVFQGEFKGEFFTGGSIQVAEEIPKGFLKGIKENRI